MTSRTRKTAARVKRALGEHRATTGALVGYAYAANLWIFVIAVVIGVLYKLFFS